MKVRSARRTFTDRQFLLLQRWHLNDVSRTVHSPEAQTAQVRAAIAAEAIIDELAILLAGLKRLGKATHGPGATDTN